MSAMWKPELVVRRGRGGSVASPTSTREALISASWSLAVAGVMARMWWSLAVF